MPREDGARASGRVRGGRGAVPARAGTRVRPDPRALLALRRGRARPARDVGRAARADVPHPRAAQEHGGADGGRGRARAADRRGVADHRRGRPHRRRQRRGARAPGLVLRRARRARRGHPVRRRHGAVPADESRGGQGLARARARAAPDLRGATAADQGTRDLARRDGAAAGGHAAHHRRRPGRARQWTWRPDARAGQSARPRRGASAFSAPSRSAGSGSSTRRPTRR